MSSAPNRIQPAARNLLNASRMGKRNRVLCQSVPTSRVYPALLVSAVLSTIGSWTEVAGACSYALPPPELVGYPKDGDAQVPIDVVPFFDTFAAGILSSSSGPVAFSLRSSTGTVVEVAPTEGYHWTFELTPQTELEPNTTYTLEATLPVPTGQPVIRSLTFTTSGQRAAAPAKPDGAFIQHYRFNGAMSSCDPQRTGSCVAFTEGPLVANFVDEFGQEHEGYLWQEPVLSNLSGIDQGTNFRCVNLRSRAANGALSSPVSLCSADGPLFELSGSAKIGCSARGLTQAGQDAMVNGDASSDSDGCAFAPKPVCGLGWIGLGLALASAFARRARRQSSSFR